MRNICTLLVILTLAGSCALAKGLSAQDPSQQQQTPQTPQQQQTPPSPGQTGMTSQALQSQIQTAFHQDSALSNVTVSVTEDKIDLSGTVATKADKDKARTMAESNSGGRKVVDKIKVSGSESSPRSAPPKS